MSKLPEKYIPQDQESLLNELWEKNNLGQPKNTGKPAFSMVLPPPNATGELHLGHALMLTIEDIYSRYKRLNGFETNWIPGTDHAAIATQAKVEKMLPQGETRHTLGREKFLQKVNEFVINSQDTIRSQIRVMGASLNWDKERYTLGNDESKLVQEVFIKMYNDGLIYRGTRVINWDPKAMSAIADDEVNYEEEKATLYYIKYNEDITVATSQPETKLGDPALFVNPNDERYQKYIGKEIEVDLAGNKLTLKILTDESIDQEFGTGVLGCTPAHSMVDAELGRKHKLSEIKLYGGDGIMLASAGKYAGLTIMEARKQFVEDLKKSGQLIKEEEYQRQIPVSERTGEVILNIPSEQWFVNVDKKFNSAWGLKSLKEISLEVVQNGSIEIVPERFNKIYFNWMNNLHDWCISRQIWFGHRIPAFYSDLGNTFVGLEKPIDTENEKWTQDPDTLDTWFSSGMWAFSCFLENSQEGESLENWIKRSKENDLGKYHPTSMLETGYDILFFWVARMILLTTYVMGEVPFKKVYLHGLVRDEQGRKFSKSLGNGIDPRQTSKDYGADATRLALILGSTPGNDTKLGISKIEGYRNYVTKIWNISKFILTRLDDAEKLSEKTSLADKWILSKLQKTILEVNKAMENDRLSDAGTYLYDFIWRDIADWYIEIIKIPEFYPNKEILEYLLRTVLILQHPFTPFITEFIWQSKWSELGTLAEYKEKFPGANWPEVKKGHLNDDLEEKIELIKNIIERIRYNRAERKIPPAEILNIEIKTDKKVEELLPIVERLAKVKLVNNLESEEDPFVSGVVIKYDFNKFSGIDPEKKKAEIDNLKKYIELQENKLANVDFVNKAPAQILEREKQKLQEAKEKLKKLT